MEQTADKYDSDRKASERQYVRKMDDAINRIKVAKQGLPESLQENKMQADRLLFREAQQLYANRKVNLHK